MSVFLSVCLSFRLSVCLPCSAPVPWQNHPPLKGEIGRMSSRGDACGLTEKTRGKEEKRGEGRMRKTDCYFVAGRQRGGLQIGERGRGERAQVFHTWIRSKTPDSIPKNRSLLYQLLGTASRILVRGCPRGPVLVQQWEGSNGWFKWVGSTLFTLKSFGR